jgi:isoleucyl-tRNA synthetase
VLHDGPPYANGPIHLGHALNKILKDCINRFMVMNGHRVHFIMGWDCNGLPIETKVEANFVTDFGLKMPQIRASKEHIIRFRAECDKFARKWIAVQHNAFNQLGILAAPEIWTTIDLSNQIAIIELLHKFALDGLIYRGLKPVFWSCEEGTALAEAEVEYKTKESQAIDVAFLVAQSNPEILSITQGKPLIIPIWTTTPWTIPSNRAVSYNINLEYVVGESGGSYFLVASALLDEFQRRTGKELQNIAPVHSLEGLVCRHPMTNTIKSPLLHSDHVTDGQGTGFVHIAPDYGIDDFKLCSKHNIGCLGYINDSGYFIEDLPDWMSFLTGKFYSNSEASIISTLNEQGVLLSCAKIEHQHPHSWRSKKPLIYRATSQCFISLQDLREKCLSEMEKVLWLPPKGKERFRATLQTRNEWCISRQRLWGTPIALYCHKTSGKLLLDPDILEKTRDLLSKEGISSWWDDRFHQKVVGDSEYIPLPDIVDVWFESGTTQKFILQALNKYPADLYLEGTDQHRGWFQSSMLNGVFETGKAPYRWVKTHGYIVDKSGQKMSKSASNGQAPDEIIETHGPDILRIALLRQSSDADLNWSQSQLKDVEQMYYKIRNTIKYLLMHAVKGPIDLYELSGLELWLLSKVSEIQGRVSRCLDPESGNFLEVHQILNHVYNFCDMTLSRLYFDMQKDTLYWEGENNPTRVQVKACLAVVLENLLKWLAPIMPFGAEEAWLSYTGGSSVHLEKFDDPLDLSKFMDKITLVEELINIKKVLNKKIEKLREDGVFQITLDAKIAVSVKRGSKLAYQVNSELLKKIAIVSDLRVTEVDSESDGDLLKDILDIQVSLAEGFKCVKCKRRVSQVENDICTRCSAG